MSKIKIDKRIVTAIKVSEFGKEFDSFEIGNAKTRQIHFRNLSYFAVRERTVWIGIIAWNIVSEYAVREICTVYYYIVSCERLDAGCWVI